MLKDLRLMCRKQMLDENVKGKSHRWVLATLSFTHLSQHFYTAIPILYQNIRNDLGLNYTQIGIMTGTNNILGGFLQIVYSVAGRRFPRRILLGFANLAIALGCSFMGSADRFIGLIFGYIIGGMGQAGQHPMGTSIIAEKYGKKRVGGALSIFYGLGYIGNIIGPVFLTTIAILASWRFSLYFLALIPFTTGLNVLYYLRKEPAGDKTLQEGPQESLGSVIKSVIRIKGTLYVLAAQSFIVGGTGLGVIITWVPQFLRDPTKGLGLGIGEASLISSVATAGGVVGTIIVGRLADRLGHLRTAIACLCSTILTVYLLTLYSSFTPILVLHLFIIGISTFSIPTLIQSHLTLISTHTQRDILLGLYFALGFGISSLWSTIIGNLIDVFSFSTAWILMSTLGILALFMLFNAYRHYRRP